MYREYGEVRGIFVTSNFNKKILWVLIKTCYALNNSLRDANRWWRHAVCTGNTGRCAGHLSRAAVNSTLLLRYSPYTLYGSLDARDGMSFLLNFQPLEDAGAP